MFKAFINNQETALVLCPNCKQSAKLPLSSFNGRRVASIRCYCGHLFDVSIDYRSSHRKQTSLDGYFHILSSFDPSLARKDRNITIPPQTINCRVVNLSRKGMGIMPFINKKIEPGSALRIVFSLDDSSPYVLAKQVEVKTVGNRYLACAFPLTEQADQAINRFLL